MAKECEIERRREKAHDREERRERLAAALRDNLRKRKLQARLRASRTEPEPEAR